ncbi:hypothetical protein OG895_43270 [Streptomyces sp. NBC_00201]|uniref:hypothetical protein n=1 Tax=unclassified Streptomyces TaxID=2593676 RepID=UPI002259B9FF|nr:MULTISPECIES: hypothetical protein [unclassified Streptomyces]MCX5063717.1 hypothetical protein [Streptomyces sp. NBC_00452]MCX5251872.1 hypothetical protein [Streptomyces sp. NBC_00201]MCX5294225.1 hypothetical protein [Streptomyces sp. NBC_00183]
MRGTTRGQPRRHDAAITTLVSACIAAIAAFIALYAARGNAARAGFDLARTLYNDLTTEATAQSRSALEFYRRGNAPADQALPEVMNHYFSLLWQFEKVYAGRESLARQRRLNGTQPAVRFLDDMIGYHVSEWGARWLQLHNLIDIQLGPDDQLDDRHTLQSFCKLADQFPAAREAAQAIRAAVPGTNPND